MDVLFDVYARIFSSNEHHVPLSKEFIRQFTNSNADTIFHGGTLALHKFSYRGVIYTGGEVKYIGVGMLLAHYRLSFMLINPIVTDWNLNEYRIDGRIYNLKQIRGAQIWAFRGYVGYF